MDAATAGVIATGAVGVAGIAAAFFAPAWSQQVIEERREARAFRRARRLVAEEMEIVAVMLENAATKDGPPSGIELLVTPGWDAEKTILAESLDEKLWREVALVHEVIVREFMILRHLADLKLSAKAEGGDADTLDSAKRIKAAAVSLRDAEALHG